mgnify:CR=1 FL=1
MRGKKINSHVLWIWIFGTILLLEAGSWGLLKMGMVPDLRKIDESIYDGNRAEIRKPRVIPHPYFGYLMTPNNTVVQFAAGNK